MAKPNRNSFNLFRFCVDNNVNTYTEPFTGSAAWPTGEMLLVYVFRWDFANVHPSVAVWVTQADIDNRWWESIYFEALGKYEASL